VYALFPLLEHVRVFGAEYVSSVEDALEELGY
ncbi:fructosamine kinase, partial [Salinisphaera sp. USBA-960]|nr:fructosamine kinase [Salifodinibacter halophilus]